MGRASQPTLGSGVVASAPHVEEDLEAQDQRPAQAGEPRQQAERRPGLTSPRFLRRPRRTRRHQSTSCTASRSQTRTGGSRRRDDPATQAWVEEQNLRTDLMLRNLPGRADAPRPAQLAAPRRFVDRVRGRRRSRVLARALGRSRPSRAGRAAGEGARRRPHARRPAPADRRSDRGARLVPPVPRRSAHRVRHLDRGRRAQHVARPERRDRRAPAGRDPQHPRRSIAWMPDGSAFAYTRYPEPTSVPEDDAATGARCTGTGSATLAPRRAAVGRPAGQDRVGQRLALARRSLAAPAPLARLDPGRRAPDRPAVRMPAPC